MAIRRNVFDHGEPIPGDGDDAAAHVPARVATPCTGLTVLSTVIDTSDPRRSLATVRDARGIEVLGVGEPAGDGTVAAVGDELDDASMRFVAAIVLARPDGRLSVCRSGGDTAAADDASAPQTNAATGVRRIDDRHFEISSATVADALGAGMAKLEPTVRIVPYFEGAEQKGFKLYAIQPGSLLASIGLRDGDVLERVDGYEVANPQQVLRAYELLKNERELTVEVGRDGATTTLSYSIR